MSFRWSRPRLPVVQPATALPFVSLAALVLLLKLPTLATPAYWDEMGWVSQAHWLSERSLLRALPGLRPPATFWGHPTGLHATLAALWNVVGPSIQSAHLLIACFAALGVCSTFLLSRWLYDERTGLFAALFLVLSPLYLAQSGMFLADIPMTALGVLSIYLALKGRFVPYVLCASYMVLVKETAIALVVALVLYRLLTARPLTKGIVVDAVTYGVPLFVIGAFVVLQKLATGKFFFIYPFDIELFELSPAAVRTQFERITQWIFLEQLRYVFTALIVLNLILHPESAKRRELILFLLILLLSGYSFSGLYFLPRYLLPVIPFFYIMAARSVMDLIRSKRLQTAANVAILGVLTWSLTAQPFGGNGEFNMRYLDVVRMHEALIGHLVSEVPDARILTSWPHTSQLTSPVLGYVPRPMKAKDFSAEADLGESDLILVSSPAPGEMDELRELAERNDWRLLRRLQRDAIWMELYGRPMGTASGSVE